MKRLLFVLALVPLFAANAAPVVVQATPLSPDRTIVMVGEGTVKAMPDTAVISGGVVTRARRAADALRDNNEAMAKAIEALKGLGLTDKQIGTESVTVEPQYERDRNGNPDMSRGITGYRVINRIAVTLKDKIERASEVFDTLIQNGANDTATVTFKLRNFEPLIERARTEAAKAALAAAATYAKALGNELGQVQSVREGANGQVFAEDIGAFPNRNINESLQRIPGVDIGSRIEASELTITRIVTVTWTLK